MQATEVIERIREGKGKKSKVYPQHVCRASEIGHPCERYLVYLIANWQDKAAPSPELQFIFQAGKLVEDLAIEDFHDAGFKVYRPEPDRAIQESRPRITGHVDIRVDFGDGQVFTGEIKGLNVYDWEKLNTVEDFFRSKKAWIQKYPAQLMTYLYIKAEDRGFFYLKSIPRFQPKFIWIDLDWGYMEQILQKTERVEHHLAAGTYPPPMEYDDHICRWCPFTHICTVDRIGTEVEITDNEELLELLAEYETLKPGAKRYKEVDERITDLVKGREKVLAGDWFVQGKWLERANYPVPDEIKAQYKTVTQYWRKSIIRVEAKEPSNASV